MKFSKLCFLLALLYVVFIFIRTFMLSMKPSYFKDIDFHCYKRFTEIFLRNETNFEPDAMSPIDIYWYRRDEVRARKEQEAIDAAVAAAAAAVESPSGELVPTTVDVSITKSVEKTSDEQEFDLLNSKTWTITNLATTSEIDQDAAFHGARRDIGIIGKLLTLFIHRPSVYLAKKIPAVGTFFENIRLRLKSRFVLNYEYFICDYGPMYYPAGFILLYVAILWFIKGNARSMQFLHAVSHFVSSVGSSWLFWEYYGIPVQLWMLTCAWASQTIYVSGIASISNDAWFTLFSVLMLIGIKKRWYFLSSFFFSFAVGFKMNALLYGPAVLVVYLSDLSLVSVFFHFLGMGLLQLALASVFMLENFKSYIEIAYNFSRDFDHDQNIKWGFLGDTVRHQPYFYSMLLLNTVGFLTLFLAFQYKRLARHRKAWIEASSDESSSPSEVSRIQSLFAKERLFTMVGSHFISFIFVRGLHIQFSLWIYFSIPFILQCVFLDGRFKTEGLTSFQKFKSGALQYILVAGYMLLFDVCVAFPSQVIHTMQIIPMMKCLFNLDFYGFWNHFALQNESFFGRLQGHEPIRTILHNAEMMGRPYFNVLGHYYREGYTLKAIPPSAVIFLMECIVLIFIFKRLTNSAFDKVASSEDNKEEKVKVE